MDQNQTELNPLKNIEGAIEAILFAAGYPVKYAKLAEVLGLDIHNVKTVIEHMAKEYNPENQGNEPQNQLDQEMHPVVSNV